MEKVVRVGGMQQWIDRCRTLSDTSLAGPAYNRLGGSGGCAANLAGADGRARIGRLAPGGGGVAGRDRGRARPHAADQAGAARDRCVGVGGHPQSERPYGVCRPAWGWAFWPGHCRPDTPVVARPRRRPAGRIDRRHIARDARQPYGWRGRSGFADRIARRGRAAQAAGAAAAGPSFESDLADSIACDSRIIRRTFKGRVHHRTARRGSAAVMEAVINPCSVGSQPIRSEYGENNRLGRRMMRHALGPQSLLPGAPYP